MKIEFEGRVYDFDLDELDVEQALRIEKHIKAAGLGETLLEWEQGLEKASAPCFQALGWLILRGGDLSVRIGDVNFKVMKLARVWGEAAERERAAAQEEPDPTTPAGSSTPGTPASTPSPTGQNGSAARAPASTTASGPTG